jgi:hypothetical protein
MSSAWLPLSPAPGCAFRARAPGRRGWFSECVAWRAGTRAACRAATGSRGPTGPGCPGDRMWARDTYGSGYLANVIRSRFGMSIPAPAAPDPAWIYPGHHTTVVQ